MVHLSKKYAYDGKVKKSKVYDEARIEKLAQIHKQMKARTIEGAEHLEWIDYINSPDTNFIIQKMYALFAKWQEAKVNTLIIAGIGGSALGARAAIHMCVNKYMRGGIKIIWIDSISPSSNAELLRHLRKFNIRPAGIIISKSGTTLETLIGYRFIKFIIEYKYDKNPNEKLAIVTGVENNELRKIAKQQNYPIFDIPTNIGGRFSALTPAGLLPMIMAGVDVYQVIEGAKQAIRDCSSPDYNVNEAYDLALHRVAYYEAGYVNEVVDSYEKKLSALLEQCKQLYAETEAKDGKGLFPVPATYTRDLHSIGQYLQDGPKTFFETTIWVRKSNGNARIPDDLNSSNSFSYLEGLWLSEVNKLIYRSVAEAHAKIAKVPVLLVEMDKMDPFNYGYFYAWLSISVIVSAYLMDANPFNQPGVETYKSILKEKLAELKENVLRRKAERANEIDTDVEDEDSEEEVDATVADDEPTISKK